MAMRSRLGLTAVILGGLVAGCSGGGGGNDGDSVALPAENLNTKPSYLGTVQKTTYDGGADDLLTAGLGRTGLAGAAPGYVDGTNPTAAELRRNAIYNNYRALIDPTAAGGFGTLYGPNIDNAGNPTLGEGKIAGEEYIAYADDGSGKVNVTLMVQVPASFDRNNPCIVTATSSGSRGVYGAIGTAGDWGLKQGCAVAYTDKGSGIGYHNLANNTVNLIDGTRASAATAGNRSHFTADLTDAQRTTYNATFANRVAVKQAHSKTNSEKDWGKFTLQAVEFAFYVLNEKFGATARDGSARLATITPANTTVIASSASNGGGAAILAAEQDTRGLIDGVAVSEPVVEVSLPATVKVQRNGADVARSGLHLFDTMTISNLYQPCAVYAASAGASYLRALIPQAQAEARCADLVANNLLTGADPATQAENAMTALRNAGWEAESNTIHASHYGTGTTALLAAFYAAQYGKFGVEENICGYSLGGLAAIPAANEAQWFGAANGLTGTGFTLLNNATNAADNALNTSGAICLRKLATGTDITAPGNPPLTSSTTPTLAQSQRVRAGMAEVLRSGNLRGKPAIIVHGRADTLIPVNHNSRAYYALNKSIEGAGSKLSYIEIENAHHFDSFNSFLGGTMIPIHLYHVRAMNAMWNHLRSGTALPPSQVVRTTAPGGSAIAASNVPAISAAPAAGNQISFASNTMNVPN